MELNQTVTILQDEVKLLKAEIKTILKEIRTAVLSSDNPFAMDANPPTVHVVAGPEAGGPGAPPMQTEAAPVTPAPPPTPTPAPPPAPPPAAWPAGPTPQATAPPVPPAPSAAPAAPTGPVAVSAGGPWPAPTPQPAPVPATPPGAPTPQAPPAPATPPGAPTQHPAAGPGLPAAPSSQLASHYAEREPTPLRPAGHEAPDRSPAQRWNLLTIAGLAAWAEDAVAALGPERFQIVLSLACCAELLPPDVRDVLGRVAELTPVNEVKDRPMNVIECLVVLHQLETTLQGEIVTKPLRGQEAA